MARRERRGLIILMAVTLVICLGKWSVINAEPYASISVPDGINLGNVSNYGSQTFNSTIRIHVIANCPHRIDATIGAFSCTSGGLIPKARTSVEMLPPLFSPTATPPEGLDVDINLKFTVNVEASDPAGDYKGSLIITIMAEP